MVKLNSQINMRHGSAVVPGLTAAVATGRPFVLLAQDHFQANK